MDFKKRCAVFSCLGLGDGLIALVLSNNLHLNGFEVTTFHPSLNCLQKWFPHLPLRPFPAQEELGSVLKEFDRFFLIYEKSEWMQAVLDYTQKNHPEKTTILNPIATPNRDYPYWEQGRFDGNRPFVENLYVFCKNVMKFMVVTKSNGIVSPDHVKPRRFEKRIILHPASSRSGKNWKREKYFSLASKLQSQGFSLSFILTQEERKGWDLENYETPLFSKQSELAAYICESGYMIGNDSGIGHLASCMGLPTITICRNEQSAKFWRPAWAPGRIITPSRWVPNLKGLRLRDRYWKDWISVRKVLHHFHDIAKT